MAKIDKLKEEIGWLKILFAILIATDISLVAWLVQNYGKASQLLLIVCAIGVLLVTFAVVWINRVAYRKIDELEELCIGQNDVEHWTSGQSAVSDHEDGIATVPRSV